MGKVVLVPYALARLGTLELQQLGEDEPHEPRELEELQPYRGARREQDLVELRRDTLGRDDGDALGIAPYGGEGLGIDEEAQLRGEA